MPSRNQEATPAPLDLKRELLGLCPLPSDLQLWVRRQPVSDFPGEQQKEPGDGPWQPRSPR